MLFRAKDCLFLLVLVNAYKGSVNFRNREEIKNVLGKNSSLGNNSSEFAPKGKSQIPSGKTDQRNVAEGSNRKRFLTPRSGCSISISE